MNDKILYARVQTVVGLLSGYSVEEPLSAYLKRHFVQNKKYGSKDRKAIADLMYHYYRLGRMGERLPTEHRIWLAVYLFMADANRYSDIVAEKTGIVETPAEFGGRLEIVERLLGKNRSGLFPLMELLSEKIDPEAFVQSLGSKPEVWIRLRRNANAVRQNLEREAYKLRPSGLLENAFAVENPKGLEQSGMFQKGSFEIQDLSSQLCASYIEAGENATVWDACAGAGGKALYLADRYPDISIKCTDIRQSIVKNLEARAKRAGQDNIDAEVLDVTDEHRLKNWPGDWKHIVADVPCSGSGTWRRTPEQMAVCTHEQIIKYSELQKTILRNLAAKTAKGGYIYYMTCSLYSVENEDVTSWAASELNLEITMGETVGGYEYGADTMYFCKLRKL